MDTPAAPDPNLNARVAVLEEIATATKDAIIDLRAEMRASRNEMSIQMRELRTAQRSDFRWLLSVMFAGYASLLPLMAHGFRWL